MRVVGELRLVDVVVDHAHLHLNVEHVARPVGHVVEKLVV